MLKSFQENNKTFSSMLEDLVKMDDKESFDVPLFIESENLRVLLIERLEKTFKRIEMIGALVNE